MKIVGRHGEGRDRKERDGTGWRGTRQDGEGLDGVAGAGWHGEKRNGMERDGTR